MKKNVILLSLLFVCFAYISEAHVWRLNNQPGVSANFKTNLQNAIEQINGNSNFVIKNNVIWGNNKTYNALHINNILLVGNFTNGTSGLTANNLCNGTQYPASNNNKLNVDMSTVFADYDKYIVPL